MLATALLVAGCAGSAAAPPLSAPATATLTPAPAVFDTPLPAAGSQQLQDTATPQAVADMATPVAETPASDMASPVPSESPAATSQPTPAGTGSTASSSTVLYQDDFTDPTSGWPDELVFQDYYVGYHEPDFYHVEVHTPNDSAIVTVPDRTFNDFEVETHLLVALSNTAPNGDFRYGLAFRREGNLYYAFTISPRTKTWYVLKSSPGSLQVMIQGHEDSIQGLQAEDTLRVNAQGSLLTFYVNDKLVGQIDDPDYASGEVGFYVETFDSPKVHVHYDDLIIRQPENPAPQPVVAPSPAPLSSPMTILTCTVNVDLLRLRSGPRDGDQPTIAGLFKDTQLEAIARNADSSWILVRIRGSSQEGWVSAEPSLTACDGPIEGLPVSAPPPSPTTAS